MEAQVVARWRERLEKARADPAWVKRHAERDAVRERVLGEMQALLRSFLSRAIDVEQFRETFDLNTRSEWDVFGLKGPSGAMFLNKLVKHVPDRTAVTEELTKVLPVPIDEASARNSMEHFVSYLRTLVRQGIVTAGQIQLGRSTFLLSAWWHLQDREVWPVFYASARKALEADGPYRPTRNLAETYFH